MVKEPDEAKTQSLEEQNYLQLQNNDFKRSKNSIDALNQLRLKVTTKSMTKR